jgi:hypothetical protein
VAELRKFIVTAEVTISMHVEVMAKSKAEAKRLAGDAPMIGLCHQCSGSEPGSWSTSGELDGMPRKLRIEEE